MEKDGITITMHLSTQQGMVMNGGRLILVGILLSFFKSLDWLLMSNCLLKTTSKGWLPIKITMILKDLRMFNEDLNMIVV